MCEAHDAPANSPAIGTEQSYELERAWLTEKLARTHGPDWVKAHRGHLDNQWEQGMALGLTRSDTEWLRRATPEQLAWAKKRYPELACGGAHLL